jgi:prevent-host-death family protein
MKIVSVAEAKAQFSAYLKESEEGPVVVTRNGRPVVVLLAVRDDDELEDLILVYSPRLQAILEKSRRQIRAGKGIGHEEFWRAVAAAKPARPRGKRKKPAAPKDP